MKTNVFYTDYNNVYKAIIGDKVAHKAIEVKYGKMNSIPELHNLGTNLYKHLGEDEKKNGFCSS